LATKKTLKNYKPFYQNSKPHEKASWEKGNPQASPLGSKAEQFASLRVYPYCWKKCQLLCGEGTEGFVFKLCPTEERNAFVGEQRGWMCDEEFFCSPLYVSCETYANLHSGYCVTPKPPKRVIPAKAGIHGLRNNLCLVFSRDAGFALLKGITKRTGLWNYDIAG